MSFDHYERFFTFFAAGLGLFLAGGINLVLGLEWSSRLAPR